MHMGLGFNYNFFTLAIKAQKIVPISLKCVKLNVG